MLIYRVPRSLCFKRSFYQTKTIRNMTTSASSVGLESTAYTPRYIDIGINLADPIFRGIYHGSQRHTDDLAGVIARAREVGCTKLMVTGSDFKSSRDALELAAEYPGTVYATAGIHPCSSSIFGSQKASNTPGSSTPCDPRPATPLSEEQQVDPKKSAEVIEELTTMLADARSRGSHCLVAMGEFGLDYDRLHYCNKQVQIHSFRAQLKMAASLQPQLPLFLHSRAAHEDFVRLLKDAFGERLERLEKGGVVHSFTGTIAEMEELMELGLFIGINGCSFKTAENCEVVKRVCLDRLMIETDGPWCEVRPSHEGWKYLIETKSEHDTSGQNGNLTPTIDKPKQQKQGKKNQKKEPEVPERYKVVKKEKWEEGAMVKGRNEPCNIERIAKIVAGIKGITIEEVCEAAWRNTIQIFDIGEAS